MTFNKTIRSSADWISVSLGYLYTFFICPGFTSALSPQDEHEPKVIEDRPNPALQVPNFLFVGECY